MVRFIARRLGLAVITLFLLSLIVFTISNVLPQDVGRSILGPFASAESVEALNQRLGTDRPRDYYSSFYTLHRGPGLGHP